MSERLIDPNLKFVEIFVDELHWVKLTELAKEKNVPVDKVIGTLFELALIKLGKIKVGDLSESPLRVEVTLEPIREDEEFLDALIVERNQIQKDREIEKMVGNDSSLFNWGGEI